MDKQYFIRVYTFGLVGETIINVILHMDGVEIANTIPTQTNVQMYDIRCNRDTIALLLAMGIYVLPHNHFEDFEITCPHCGNRIDDDMILKAYDDSVLNGFNIRCNRTPRCGIAHANVTLVS